MKCIRSNSLLGKRYFGFLFRMQRINYWNYDETFFPFGNRTSYVNYISNNNYYLVQVLLLVYVERRTPKQQLISQYPYRPQVYLLVIFVTLQDLWGKVEGSTAKRASQFLLFDFVYCPPKITHLDVSLH